MDEKKSIYRDLKDIRIYCDVRIDESDKYYVNAEDFMNTAEVIIQNEKFRVELKNLIKRILL